MLGNSQFTFHKFNILLSIRSYSHLKKVTFFSIFGLNDVIAYNHGNQITLSMMIFLAELGIIIFVPNFMIVACSNYEICPLGNFDSPQGYRLPKKLLILSSFFHFYKNNYTPFLIRKYWNFMDKKFNAIVFFSNSSVKIVHFYEWFLEA